MGGRGKHVEVLAGEGSNRHLVRDVQLPAVRNSDHLRGDALAARGLPSPGRLAGDDAAEVLGQEAPEVVGLLAELARGGERVRERRQGDRGLDLLLCGCERPLGLPLDMAELGELGLVEVSHGGRQHVVAEKEEACDQLWRQRGDWLVFTNWDVRMCHPLEELIDAGGNLKECRISGIITGMEEGDGHVHCGNIQEATTQGLRRGVSHESQKSSTQQCRPHQLPVGHLVQGNPFGTMCKQGGLLEHQLVST